MSEIESKPAKVEPEYVEYDTPTPVVVPRDRYKEEKLRCFWCGSKKHFVNECPEDMTKSDL